MKLRSFGREFSRVPRLIVYLTVGCDIVISDAKRRLIFSIHTGEEIRDTEETLWIYYLTRCLILFLEKK